MLVSAKQSTNIFFFACERSLQPIYSFSELNGLLWSDAFPQKLLLCLIFVSTDMILVFGCCCHAAFVLASVLKKQCELQSGSVRVLPSVGRSVNQLGSHFLSFCRLFFLSFSLKTVISLLLLVPPQISTPHLLSPLVPKRPNPSVPMLPRPPSGNAKPRQFPWRQAAQAPRKPPTTPPTLLLLLHRYLLLLLLLRCCHRWRK